MLTGAPGIATGSTIASRIGTPPGRTAGWTDRALRWVSGGTAGRPDLDLFYVPLDR